VVEARRRREVGPLDLVLLASGPPCGGGRRRGSFSSGIPELVRPTESVCGGEHFIRRAVLALAGFGAERSATHRLRDGTEGPQCRLRAPGSKGAEAPQRDARTLEAEPERALRSSPEHSCGSFLASAGAGAERPPYDSFWRITSSMSPRPPCIEARLDGSPSNTRMLGRTRNTGTLGPARRRCDSGELHRRLVELRGPLPTGGEFATGLVLAHDARQWPRAAAQDSPGCQVPCASKCPSSSRRSSRVMALRRSLRVPSFELHVEVLQQWP